ncbi:MAG TPA: DUF6624 domain-containing protein [Salinimicrobium sp.]|nr:DUF6624 domain-containing protein [Salinimicrobium sp.]
MISKKLFRKLGFLLAGMLIINACQERNPEDYAELISRARDLYQMGDYSHSGQTYSRAFAVSAGADNIMYHYDAARSWALARHKDSAFNQLYKVTRIGTFKDIARISTDNAFNYLYTDERWMEILTRVSNNKQKAEAHLQRIMAVLDTVYKEDQVYRRQIGKIQEKFGRNSKELKENWELIGKKDSINLVKVKKILNEYGWLGQDKIGRRGNSALFLVFQHADLETQEKFLPMLREAVANGNAPAQDLALLVDRVALKQGKKQVYGSQIEFDKKTGSYFVSPLLDPDNVNKRRAEVGLGPIEDYISNWGLTWDVENYKKEKKRK